jgi:hypothetical protein
MKKCSEIPHIEGDLPTYNFELREESLEELLKEGLARELEDLALKSKSAPASPEPPSTITRNISPAKQHHAQKYKVRFKPTIYGPNSPTHAHTTEYGEEQWTTTMKFEENEYVEFTKGEHETQRDPHAIKFHKNKW